MEMRVDRGRKRRKGKEKEIEDFGNNGGVISSMAKLEEEGERVRKGGDRWFSLRLV